MTQPTPQRADAPKATRLRRWCTRIGVAVALLLLAAVAAVLPRDHMAAPEQLRVSKSAWGGAEVVDAATGRVTPYYPEIYSTGTEVEAVVLHRYPRWLRPIVPTPDDPGILYFELGGFAPRHGLRGATHMRHDVLREIVSARSLALREELALRNAAWDAAWAGSQQRRYELAAQLAEIENRTAPSSPIAPPPDPATPPR